MASSPTDERESRIVHNSRLAPRVSRVIEAGDLDEGEGDVVATEILNDASDARASDLHLSPLSDGYRVQFRIDGALLTVAELPYDLGERVLRHLKVTSGLESGPVQSPQVARETILIGEDRVDLRLTCVPTLIGEKLVARLLDPQRLDRRVTDLGLSDVNHQQIMDWLRNVSGMFLVTGLVGAGKSTTLYALLHELKSRERSIATIEDPVEYQVDGVCQMQVDQKRKLTFAEGVQAMLRLDADIMLVGEIRDDRSARAALEASSTGRVLMSSLHTRDAVGAITSLRNWGIENHEIAATLELVVDQRLVRTLCQSCRREGTPTEDDIRWLKSLGLEPPEKTWLATGCPQCRQLGFNGRSGVFEVWRLRTAERAAIRNGADEHELREILNNRKHRSLFFDGLNMALDGRTTLSELQAIGHTRPSPGENSCITIEEFLEGTLPPGAKE